MCANQTTKTISFIDCSKALSENLKSGSLLRFEWFPTYMEIEFSFEKSSNVVSNGMINFPYQITIVAETDDELQTDEERLNVLINSTTEFVEKIVVDEKSNLSILFTNSKILKFPGVAGPVDEVWTIFDSGKLKNRRKFGEECIAQSYFGDLFFQKKFLEKI